MKAGIAKCLEELIRKTYGDANGTASLVEAGQHDDLRHSRRRDSGAHWGHRQGLEDHRPGRDGCLRHVLVCDIRDQYIYTVLRSVDERAGLPSLPDHVYTAITSRVPNATPPHVTFDASDPKKLVIVYETKRGLVALMRWLVALMRGLVKGVAAYCKEKVRVSVSGHTVTTTFLS